MGNRRTDGDCREDTQRNFSGTTSLLTMIIFRYEMHLSCVESTASCSAYIQYDVARPRWRSVSQVLYDKILRLVL